MSQKGSRASSFPLRLRFVTDDPRLLPRDLFRGEGPGNEWSSRKTGRRSTGKRHRCSSSSSCRPKAQRRRKALFPGGVLQIGAPGTASPLLMKRRPRLFYHWEQRFIFLGWDLRAYGRCLSQFPSTSHRWAGSLIGSSKLPHKCAKFRVLEPVFHQAKWHKRVVQGGELF